MGETKRHGDLPDAAGRRPARRLAPGLALRFARDRRGATAIEYGLICSLIFLTIVTSVTAFGNKATNVIDNAAAAINSAI